MAASLKGVVYRAIREHAFLHASSDVVGFLKNGFILCILQILNATGAVAPRHGRHDAHLARKFAVEKLVNDAGQDLYPDEPFGTELLSDLLERLDAPTMSSPEWIEVWDQVGLELRRRANQGPPLDRTRRASIFQGPPRGPPRGSQDVDAGAGHAQPYAGDAQPDAGDAQPDAGDAQPGVLPAESAAARRKRKKQ